MTKLSFLPLGLAFPDSCASPFFRGTGMRRTRPNARSRAAKARWADPVMAAKWRAALRDPARRAKAREAARARWADPAAREEMISKMRATRTDPAVRQKRVSASKRRWADPLMREKIIAAMRATKKRRKTKDAADR